jgi:hypothetical protein
MAGFGFGMRLFDGLLWETFTAGDIWDSFPKMSYLAKFNTNIFLIQQTKL